MTGRSPADAPGLPNPRDGLTPGRQVEVVVPASSANLGPGFDSLALALDLCDRYRVTVLPGDDLIVEISGESAGEVPTDADNLVVRALRAGLAAFGQDPGGVGLHLLCDNKVPHGRGLGSSAAAIVGGVRLAAELTGIDDPARILAVATELEGHPDNVAAATYGGFVVSWMSGSTAAAVTCQVHPEIHAVLFVPEFRSATAEARRSLPAEVPHSDAAFNAGRSALLVCAITSRPELLFAATEDRLHQEQRRGNYPEAMALVDRLRAAGLAAVISGAGPSVLVLFSSPQLLDLQRVDHAGFDRMTLAIRPVG